MPNRTPTALKLLAGNPGHRPLPENEPKPEVTAPPPPKALSVEARVVWRRLVVPLFELKIMSDLDVTALALLCNAEIEYNKATAELKDNHIAESPNGFSIPSPWLGIRNKAHDQILKILMEFGMTPASRTKIQVTKADEDDPLSALTKKRRGRKPKEG